MDEIIIMKKNRVPKTAMQLAMYTYILLVQEMKKRDSNSLDDMLDIAQQLRQIHSFNNVGLIKITKELQVISDKDMSGLTKLQLQIIEGVCYTDLDVKVFHQALVMAREKFEKKYKNVGNSGGQK